jgi:hypothetical protein
VVHEFRRIFDFLEVEKRRALDQAATLVERPRSWAAGRESRPNSLPGVKQVIGRALEALRIRGGES